MITLVFSQKGGHHHPREEYMFLRGESMNNVTLIQNKKSWDKAAERFFARNPLPEYGPFAPTEDDLQLFGEVKGKRILELGCGSGHSIKYLDGKSPSELWGLDLSHVQIQTAKHLLAESNTSIQLFESPMEENPGIPSAYFDIVFSIYAIGWSTNLSKTLANVFQYLNDGGLFIFSWEHPLYNRMSRQNGQLVMTKSYHEEGAYDHHAWQEPATMQQYKLSTYINLLTASGFHIEQMIEEVCITEKDKDRHSNGWYSPDKASLLPTSFIIKCRKPNI